MQVFYIRASSLLIYCKVLLIVCQKKRTYLLFKKYLKVSFCNTLAESIQQKKLIMAQTRVYSLSEDDAEVFEFLKKVKVEHESINSIIRKKHPEIDIEEHKLNKFLTIFNAVIESNLDDLKKEDLDSEDGFTDIKIVIVTLIKLISKNIKTIDLPKKIKSGLKKLKCFIGKHGKDKASTETIATEGSTTAKTNNE